MKHCHFRILQSFVKHFLSPKLMFKANLYKSILMFKIELVGGKESFGVLVD